MIGPGSIVRCLDRDGVWHEGIADGPPENGEVWVRFTTAQRHPDVFPVARVVAVCVSCDLTRAQHFDDVCEWRGAW